MTGRRVALALMPAVAVMLLAGAHTLVTGRSMRAWFVRSPLPRFARLDEEKERALASVPGPYRAHPDPRVGYGLKHDALIDTVRAKASTDALGLRNRSGPPAAAGARRILLLGDSVAFGTGLGDAECLAQVLEDEIAAASDDDGERSVTCRTVATPGWNWRSSLTFLRDHADVLHPDFVLFLPIGNDLADSERAGASGQLELAHDLAGGRPWLRASLNRQQQLVMNLIPRVERGELFLTEPDLGSPALTSDLGGESVRRFDAMADALFDLEEELRRRDARFAVLQYEPTDFVRALQRRLATRGATAPWIPLIDEVRVEETLGDDPHPNATTVRALARWTAGSLAELGWFQPVRPVASVEGSLATRRAPPPPKGEQLERLARADRDAATALLRRVIEPDRGHGLYQVYGGLSPLRLIGPEFLAILPRGGSRLVIELEPVAGREDLLPMRVEVAVDDVTIGAVELHEGAVAPVEVELPFEPAERTRRDGATTTTIDVLLRPDRLAVIQDRGGTEVGACRLNRLAIEE